MEAISRLVERFAVPLQAASANIEEIASEFEALVHYAIELFPGLSCSVVEDFLCTYCW